MVVLVTLMLYLHSDTSAQIDGLGNRINGLAVQVGPIDERLSQVEADVADIKRRIGGFGETRPVSFGSTVDQAATRTTATASPGD